MYSFSTAILFVVGRNNDCDVVLHDGAVSRRHCVIESRGNVFVVSDLRSPNGLFLNDPRNRIDSHVLKNGDEIIFGRSRIRIELPILMISEPTEGEPGDVPFTELQSPSLTITDALMANSSPAPLPSSWQAGMTVCAPRAKLIAALDQSPGRTGTQSVFATKSPEPAKYKSRFFTDMLMRIKNFSPLYASLGKVRTALGVGVFSYVVDNKMDNRLSATLFGGVLLHVFLPETKYASSS